MYVLGIDGGGTKTSGTIVRFDGTVIDTRLVGPTNPNSLGFKRAESEIRHLIQQLKLNNPYEFNHVKAVFAGFSGVGRENEKKRMTKIFSTLFDPSCTFEVTNDAINALYSGTLGEMGIVNICGTGSITLAVDDKGNMYRVGGWGYLLEEGSGYSIGKDALKKVFAEHDGYGKKTVLTEKVMSLFSIQTPSDLVSIIYEEGKSRKAIASVTKKVFEAAQEGDDIAIEIVKNAGEEMANAICRLILKIPQTMFEQKPLNIVLAGSIYEQAEWFLPTITREIKSTGLFVNIIIPELPPVAGSVFAALKLAAVDINSSTVKQLKETWKK